jgi:hypothetical protein
MGYSRSAAAAFILLAQSNPEREIEMATLSWSRSPIGFSGPTED